MKVRSPCADRWKILNKAVLSHPTAADTLSEIQRDGHCHEAVMWCVPFCETLCMAELEVVS